MKLLIMHFSPVSFSPCSLSVLDQVASACKQLRVFAIATFVPKDLGTYEALYNVPLRVDLYGLGLLTCR